MYLNCNKCKKLPQKRSHYRYSGTHLHSKLSKPIAMIGDDKLTAAIKDALEKDPYLLKHAVAESIQVTSS